MKSTPFFSAICLFGRRQPNLCCLDSPSLPLSTIVSSKATAFAIFHHHHHRRTLVAPSSQVVLKPRRRRLPMISRQN
ncbi:unnamed protein product [Brassica oleracea]